MNATIDPKPSRHSVPAQSANPRRKRILLVDDHPLMRTGMTTLIDAELDLTVCGQASRSEEALTAIPRCSPDLIICDMTMPGPGGFELIKDVKSLFPALPVLIVSMHDEMLYAERALRAGARGYLMKEAGGEKLLEAIRKVLSGQSYVSERMATRLVENLSSRKTEGSSSRVERLTDREFEVFQLIGQGKSTREIAEQLHLSSKTVDVHRRNIKEKLQIDDVISLVRYAVRWTESDQQG